MARMTTERIDAFLEKTRQGIALNSAASADVVVIGMQNCEENDS